MLEKEKKKGKKKRKKEKKKEEKKVRVHRFVCLLFFGLDSNADCLVIWAFYPMIMGCERMDTTPDRMRVIGTRHIMDPSR